MASQQEQQRVQELGDFLRTRRGRLSPEQAGFPRGNRRRTPGLRRAEVAQLAGVSVEWYTWLEQGRPISVSIQVLESLVQALHLNTNEREHLFFLAHQQSPPESIAFCETVSAATQNYLDHHELSPAFVVGPRWDVIAWNVAARAVLYDFPRMTMQERNILWLTFTSTTHRQRVVDWESHARRILAQFRSSYGHFPGDPVLTKLIQDLTAISPEFRAWWPDHEVLRGPEGKKVFNHPQAGSLIFEHLMLQIYDAPGLKVIVYTPTNEGDTPAKIRQLLQEQESFSLPFERNKSE